MKKQLFYIVSTISMFGVINSFAQTDTVKSNTENKFRIEIQPLSLLQSLTYSVQDVKRLKLNIGFSYRLTSKLWLKTQIGYFNTIKKDSAEKELLYSNNGIAAKLGAEWINQIEKGIQLGIYSRLAFSTNKIYSLAKIKSNYYGNYQHAFNEEQVVPWLELGFRTYYDLSAISALSQNNKNKLYIALGPELMISNAKNFQKDFEIIQINGWGTPGLWGYRKSSINLRIGVELGYTF